MSFVRAALKKAWTVFHRDDGRTLMFMECFDKYLLMKLKNESAGRKFFALLDGTRTVDQLVSALQADYPGVTRESVERTLAALASKNLLEDHAVPVPEGLTQEELNRYHRQIGYFAEFERNGLTRYDFQLNLKRSRVAVLGLGGVGSWALHALAVAGVGEIIGVDADRVEVSNLHRQILYRDQHVGRFKAECAAETVAALNPAIRFVPIVKRLTSPDDVEEIIQGARLVLCLVDEPLITVRRWVHTACVKLGIPMMLAGGMEVGPIFVPGETPCYTCLEDMLRREVPFYDGLVEQYLHHPADWVPAMGTVSAVVGSYVAYEAIKHLSGYAHPATTGQMLRINAFTLNNTLVAIPPSPSCGCLPQTVERTG